MTLVKVMHAVELSKATLAHQDNEHCKVKTAIMIKFTVIRKHKPVLTNTPRLWLHKRWIDLCSCVCKDNINMPKKARF